MPDGKTLSVRIKSSDKSDIQGRTDTQSGNTKNNSLQDVFLNKLRRDKTPVTLFLIKGVKLQGIVTWFDNFSMLLRRDGQSQLVYKHAISTISQRCGRAGDYVSRQWRDAAGAHCRV